MEKYTFRYEDRDHVLESDGERVLRDGVDENVSVVSIGPGRYSLIKDGRCVTVLLEEVDSNSMLVRRQSGRQRIDWKDRRSALMESMGFASTAKAGHAVTKAPMPGLVLKVLVEPGQRVSAGDPLLVLEAMKMENELRAPVDGLVAGVHVSEGDAVGKGALLIEFGD